MKNIYHATFCANNESTYGRFNNYTSKAVAIKEIRAIANGNRLAGHKCIWTVLNEEGRCVAAGCTLENGKKIRACEEELFMYDEVNV